jgi:thiol-disulfide isomerase/thioredoxin
MQMAAAAAATVVLSMPAGCGSDEEATSAVDSAATVDAFERRLADAPPPLAALFEQQSELLGGGVPAFEQRLDELRGYPVVVNKWASWCGPCRAEFPFFQQQASKHGDEVAFLGINSQDSDDAALTFLEEFPLPYPSYSDPELEIAETLDAEIEFPSTIFFNAEGEQVYVQRGGYADEADLAADIERYAQPQG